MQKEHIWLKITTKDTKEYELSSTIFHPKLFCDQGCSSKMHCEEKVNKRALLSSETEPQDSQPVCNPSKEWQLDGHCFPSSGVTPFWCLLTASVQLFGHQNQISTGCVVLGGQAKQSSRHLKAEAQLALLFWGSRVNALHLTRHHGVTVRRCCCWTDWKQQLGETPL